jgi:uncharacterized membrane protein YfcA
MSPGVSTVVLVAIGIVLFCGGTVKGAAGFGYGMVSLSLLTVVVDPQVAVVLMIVPPIAANLDLVRELGRDDVKRCGQRFSLFIVGAIGGTLLGMALLTRLPTAALTFVIGLIVLTYVLFRQEAIALPLPRTEHLGLRYFRPSESTKAGFGFVGGVVFGGASLAVLMVTYLDSLKLERSLFVGTVAMILLGISTVRIGTAWVLGLYGSAALLVLSAGAAVPGVLGVATGAHVRHKLPEQYVETGVHLLLTVAGLKLTLGGLGLL